MVDEAHICTLALRPEWRGRGLGELLLARLMALAMDYPVEAVTLEVRETNVVAQNLYHKYGFSVVGRRKRYYSDNSEDAYIMSTDSVRVGDYGARLRELTKSLLKRLRSEELSAPTSD